MRERKPLRKNKNVKVSLKNGGKLQGKLLESNRQFVQLKEYGKINRQLISRVEIVKGGVENE